MIQKTLSLPLSFQSKTLVIVTGGTIEGLYNPDKGTPYIVPLPDTPEGSAIPEALKRLGLSKNCTVLKHAMHDSKYTSPEEIQELFHYMVSHRYAKVVFVCGTDAMPAIGRYFQALLQEKPDLEKYIKIVLTGAMKPLRNGKLGIIKSRYKRAWRSEFKECGQSGREIQILLLVSM